MRIYDFNKVVGNASTVRLIKNSLKNQAYPKFSILYGLPGTGKSTCAEIAGLSLTCMNPKDGSPCLECKSCKQNLEALKTTGQSKNLIKKNIGILNSRKDVLEMIKEIFVLQASVGNNVYILEEAHSLNQADQTALLEEIDRLSENTYIILCTTKQTRLLPELRSRAINFTFNRLAQHESKLLFDMTCQQLGVKKTKSSIASMIIRYAKGIPRDLVNLVEFINANNPSEEDIASFLNYIDSEQFTELISSMGTGVRETALTLESLMSNHTSDVILDQFKEYFSNVMFFIIGGIGENLSPKEKKILKTILSPSTVLKVCKQLETTNSNTISESEIKMLFIKLTQIIKGANISDIHRENKKMASKQSVNANSLKAELAKDELESEIVQTTTLTAEVFKKFTQQNAKPVQTPTEPKPVNSSIEKDKASTTSVQELNVFGGD